MTRTTCLSVLASAALLAAFTAYGCGSSSVIPPGSTGGTNGGLGGKMDSGSIIIIGGSGGGPGGVAGRGGGMAGRAGVDAGFNMCNNNAPCTAGFTCDMNCNVNGVAGMRACTCGNNGQLNCPGGNANCIRPDAGPPPPMPDAGFNACMAGTPCTAGFACRATCVAGGVAGTRACTCGNNGNLACANGGANCIPNDGGAVPDAARPDVGLTPDVPRDVPAPPIDAPAPG